MHLDQDLELIWKWLRWIQKKEMEEMTKKSLKINISISHDHAKISHDHTKISHDHAKWTRRWICVASQGEFQS